jgi:DNA topoisomerase VI B subunit
MRKRTQLVGFEFGYWKHVQYCAEFIDNALDAIESFQWEELQKTDSKIKFSLDQDLFLEKFSIFEAAKEEKKTQHLDNEAKHTLMQELGIEAPDLEEPAIEELETKEEESGEISDTNELEIEEEVQRIIDDMQEIIKPVENIIDVEPIVILRIREYEAPSFLTSELSQKNVMSFIFEIFDNGTGMVKIDLRKFGRYLASSKSLELKQTRGSQGFGSPSAFSDSQNTTGKPIIAVSKSSENVYATATEFFTTSKNEKKYLIHPTDIDSLFLHGTYIKLNYLNVKYIKGYVEKYIEETAYMNPHITIIYLDPDGKEKIYRRLASAFPKEPKYAKPHPSSINIGDLQDLISKSENKSIASFLKENFVRITSKTAREIIELAERDLQDNLNLLILTDGFISRTHNKNETPYYLNFEKKVYGRSTKPRDKLIIYQLNTEDHLEKFWNLISKYNKNETEKEKIDKEIKKLNNRIDKSDTLKEKKSNEKQIKILLNNIEDINKDKEKIKNELNTLFKTYKNSLIELKKIKNRTDFEDLVNKVQLSKIKPTDITKEQFNSLFRAFKSIKYMSPPTDTAIPVGDLILENTLIKEIGLRVSEGIDDFDIPVDNISQTIDIINEEKKLALTNGDSNNNSEILADLSIDPEEVISLSSDILGNIDIVEDKLEIRQIQNSIDDLLTFSDIEPVDSYSNVFEYFIENYTKDDDFVSAETRSPTSGKGLAYVVEAVMAYSRNIEVPKRSRDVLSRFVNRTPKLRDSADCAITKAVQSVNWKNYKLETYDNNLPKGPIKLLVNVSGPFVHLMFKSQSKNALAEDENLIKEIKFCLESIGRRLRIYINRRASIHQTEKRASLIERYIPIFSQSIYNIASKGESKYKAVIKLEDIINSMKQAIGKKSVPTIEDELKTEKPEDKELDILKEVVKEEPSQVEVESSKKEIEEKLPTIDKISKKTLLNWTVDELKTYCNEQQIDISSTARKNQIIEKILDSFVVDKISKKPSERKPQVSEIITKKPTTVKPSIKQKPKEVIPQPKPPKPKSTQTTLPMITTDRIVKVLSDEWQTIKHLIFKLKIKDMMDARYLQLKLKELERKEEVLVEVKMGRKQWKLK